MTQLFNISIDGTDVTPKEGGCSISEEVNRFYDVATFTLGDTEDVILEKDVVIHYGNKTFSGFVYAVSKTGKSSLRVECRTYTAKLTEPYSPHETTVEEATTSHELCALYASRSGMPVAITAANLDFGGSYERNGTMLSSLANIAAVTGAEYWNDGSTIRIEPNKAIDVPGTVIPDSDIFDYVPFSKSVYNKGVGFITVQNGGDETNDVISKNNIYAEIDECSGEMFIFPNPNGDIEHYSGTSAFTDTTLERNENKAVLDENIISLDGAIESIKSVMLNGANISNYNFEQGHNVLYFTTELRGTLSVTYAAYVKRGYANISATPIGRFITFDLFYLDQVLSFQGFLDSKCLNASTDGDMVCIVPGETEYNSGFDAWTIGGDPEFIFYDKNIQIIRPVTSTDEAYASVEKASLEEVVNGYRYKTRYPIDASLGARSSGVDISYTTSQDGEDHFFEFTQYYPDVSVSYETPGTRHHVQFAKIDNGEITMVIKNINTGETCEYELGTVVPCEWNQHIDVNIAEELGMEVSDVRGRSVTYKTPDNSYVSVFIDDFGIAKVYVSMDGDYVIDTKNIKKRSEVVLVADVQGGQ